MKQIATLLMCLMPLLAMARGQVTCLVMDSTNALLPGVEVKIGATGDVLTTSWDGKIVFEPKTSCTQLKLQAKGFETLETTIKNVAGDSVVIIRMCHKYASQPGTFAGGSYGDGAMHKGVVVRGVTSVGIDDEVLYETAMPDSKRVVVTGYGATAKPMPAPAVMEEMESDADYFVGAASGAVNAPQAGKLTAGEVNDFAKWGLWNGVLNGSHSQYVGLWNIRAEERYVVQVVGQNGYPMVNKEVWLMAGDKQVFKAKTDNTGRAELWNNLFVQDTKETGAMSLVCEGQKVAARRFEEGLNRIELNEACNPSDLVDVFFVMDATGSMGDELRYMTAELQDVIARSQSAVEGLTIRTGALVYRDHGDNYLTRISRLSDQIGDTQTFLNGQRAGGGGDYEEAIPEALMATINAAGWDESARTRIAFLIFDAPCHSTPETLALLHQQVAAAAAQGIRLVPVVCSGLREGGELLARSMALATNGTSFFLTDDSGIGDKHLKPTTDSLKVEHLNDMLVRTIIEFSRMPFCDLQQWEEEAQEDDPIEHFLPNPTDDKNDPSAPIVLADDVLRVMPNPCSGQFFAELLVDVEGLYLVDMTGKTILSLGPQPAGKLPVSVSGLSTGVYFVKAWVGGRWQTQKVIVRG